MITYDEFVRIVPNMRARAAHVVAYNWRLRSRCPRITALAHSIGLINPEVANDFGNVSLDYVPGSNGLI